ncbi:MAG TPA: hypothetical protein VF498_03915 [Anaerolineales bacterium]
MNTTDSAFDQYQRTGLVIGVIAAAAGIASIFLSGPAQFFQAYLFAYLFWLALSLGSLAVAMLHYLTGGGWGATVRRTLQAASRTIWLMAILFIPVIAGMRFLYPWMDPGVVAADPTLQHKSQYLNFTFFLLRAVIYFVIWFLLDRRVTHMAQQEDYNVNPDQRRYLQRASAIGLLLYTLTMTFAAVDCIMSLQPTWYSTAYGLLIISNQALLAFALAIALLPSFAAGRPLSEFVNRDLYRDLGALLLTAAMFWAYVAFFQYLIIWAGNIPKEAVWYVNRFSGGWYWVAILVLVLEFVLPFAVLISLRAKRNARLLSVLSVGILVSGLVNYYWEVVPAFHPARFTIHWLDIVLPIALGGLWVAAFAWSLKRTPVLIFNPPAEQPALSQEKGPTV